MQLAREELLRAYRTMRIIREFEERLHVDFATGEIPGFVHLYAGEEASGAGIIMNLTDKDYIASNHRGHGHSIAKGCDVNAMMAEIYGRSDGLCAGKGGSMHIADLDKGMMGANGIVGGGPPLACGAALAAKNLGTGGVGIAFVGDGAFNQGTTAEGMNLAKVWDLPFVLVLENNGYAETTSSEWAMGGGDAVARAAGFGLPGVSVDGFDFFAVHEAASEAIGKARAGEGPQFIETRLSRYYGHFEGDSQTYRAKDEVKKLRDTVDCLVQFREKVEGAALLDAKDFDDIDAEAMAIIEESVVKAKASPFPTASDLLTDVYISY